MCIAVQKLSYQNSITMLFLLFHQAGNKKLTVCNIEKNLFGYKYFAKSTFSAARQACNLIFLRSSIVLTLLLEIVVGCVLYVLAVVVVVYGVK